MMDDTCQQRERKRDTCVSVGVSFVCMFMRLMIMNGHNTVLTLD